MKISNKHWQREETSPYAPWCWNIYQHLPKHPKSPSFVGFIYQHHGSHLGPWTFWKLIRGIGWSPGAALFWNLCMSRQPRLECLVGVGFRQTEGRQKKRKSWKITRRQDSERMIGQLMRSNDKMRRDFFETDWNKKRRNRAENRWW